MRRKTNLDGIEMYTHTPKRDVQFLKAFFNTSLILFAIGFGINLLIAL